MSEISNSKIKRIRKNAHVVVILGACGSIAGAVLLYLFKKYFFHLKMLAFIGAPLLVLSVMAVLICSLLLIVYSIKLGNKSDSSAYTISKELENPETVYIKECTTYLTPNYLLTLSTNPRYIKYSDMVRVYELPYVFQSFTKETCLLIKKRDGKTVMMAETAAIKSNSIMLKKIMETLKERNPNIEIGHFQMRTHFVRN